MLFPSDSDVNDSANWTATANAPCSAQGHLGLYRQIAGTALFVLVWPIVVFDFKRFPLGRPAAALLGGALMVIFYVVTQDSAYAVLGRADSLKTLFLLIGMMMLSHYFDREGVLQFVALRVLGRSGASFRSVLWKVCLTTGCLAALITNDAACLVITPLLLTEHKRQKRNQKELWPLCLAIATSANIGSSATFFGNPQNAFIASAAGVSLSQFLMSLFPAAVLGLLLNTAFLYIYSFRLLCVNGRCRRRRHDNEVTNAPRGDNSVTDMSTATTTSGVTGSTSQDPEYKDPFDEAPNIAVSREEFYRSLEPEASQQSLNRASLVAFERAAIRSTLDFSTGVWEQRVPPHFRRQPGFATKSVAVRKDLTGYGSLARAQSMPLPSPEEDQDMEVPTANGAGIPLQHNITAVVDESTPALARVSQGTGDEGTDEDSAAERRRARRQRVIFLIWLSLISLISLVLLIVPPQKIEHTSTVIEFDLGLVPFGAAILTMLADSIVYRRNAHDVMQQIDWNVILMFIGFFVWLEGFKTTCFPAWAFDALQPYMSVQYAYGVALFSVFILVASNVLSNVPLTILVVHQLCSLYKGCAEGAPLVVPAMLLAWITTVAGNFTLIGSIANLIVAEKAKTSDYQFSMTFFGHLKFGVLSTLLVIVSGLPTVYYLGQVAEEHIH